MQTPCVLKIKVLIGRELYEKYRTRLNWLPTDKPYHRTQTHKLVYLIRTRVCSKYDVEKLDMFAPVSYTHLVWRENDTLVP